MCGGGGSWRFLAGAWPSAPGQSLCRAWTEPRARAAVALAPVPFRGDSFPNHLLLGGWAYSKPQAFLPTTSGHSSNGSFRPVGNSGPPAALIKWEYMPAAYWKEVRASRKDRGGETGSPDTRHSAGVQNGVTLPNAAGGGCSSEEKGPQPKLTASLSPGGI